MNALKSFVILAKAISVSICINLYIHFATLLNNDDTLQTDLKE